MKEAATDCSINDQKMVPQCYTMKAVFTQDMNFCGA